MSILLVCAALAAFALLYTLWVPREEVVVPEPPGPLHHLLEKKKVIYDNLKDVNFEYRTGKLSDEDYQQLKTSLQYELAVVMKSIEEQEQAQGQKQAQAQPAAGKARRGRRGQVAGTPVEAAASQAPAEAKPGKCPACGHLNPGEHKHCSECGARLVMVLAAFLLLFGALPLRAEQITVEGTATNLTTGKPAAGLTVSLVSAGQTKQTLGHARADAQGRFQLPPVEAPPPPAMLILQAEHQGVRYTEPVMGSGLIELKVYNAGAPDAAIHVTERAVIFQPRGGKLLVNELYLLRNDSNPPAAYAPDSGAPGRPTFRFFVPEGGQASVQAAAAGAGGMSVPLEAKPDPVSPSLFSVRQTLKPGENRIEISYHLDYPGSLVFSSRAAEKVERTRLAVAQGVTVEGEGLRFLATEPQMKFGIYDVAQNDRWSVKLAGEAQAPPDAAGAEGGEGQGDTITNFPGAVAQYQYPLLALVGVVLAIGFARLWRQQPAP